MKVPNPNYVLPNELPFAMNQSSLQNQSHCIIGSQRPKNSNRVTPGPSLKSLHLLSINPCCHAVTTNLRRCAG